MRFTFMFFGIVLFFTSTHGVLYGSHNVLTVQAPPRNPEMTNWLHDAANWAVRNLSAIRKETLELEDVRIDHAKIVEGLYCEVGVQFGRDVVQYQFIQPLSSPVDQHGLTDGTKISPSSLSNLFSSPRIGEMILQGPLNVQFPVVQNDLHIRVPNLVEMNNIKRIRVGSQVNLKSNGITSIRLLEPVEIELKNIITKAPELGVNFKSVPHLEIVGKGISFSTEHKAKVKRISNLEIELTNTTTPQVIGRQDLTIVLNDQNPLYQYVHFMLEQAKSQLAPSSQSKLKRIVTGTAEAVTMMLIPMELKDSKSGVHSEWNVVVTQDAYGNRKIVQSEQQPPVNELTLVPGVLYNNTIEDVLMPIVVKPHEL